MSSLGDDDDSALDLADQKNRPFDSSVQQQCIQAWHPILDPEWVIYAFLLMAIIMIPLGFKLEALSEEVVELSRVYDSINPEDQLCGIGLNYNANTNCTISFVAPRDMEPPILVYYELTNFYQNHRFYVDSRDDFQLAGEVVTEDSYTVDACKPLYKLGNVTLNPCGFIANTFFNDVFTLVSGVDENNTALVMNEEGIAWQSDLEYRFKMPPGYLQEECPDDQCDESCCQEKGFSCTVPHRDPKQNNTCFAYHYPDEDTTQYLYETYPNIISPLEHVRNEHFIVWMRGATRPTFRKLYGHIQQKIPEGTELSFRINLNYVVESFGGSKALVISTNNVVGGRNPHLGPTFYYMGFFCMACGVFFATKHWFRPRKLGDRKYLQYKED